MGFSSSYGFGKAEGFENCAAKQRTGFFNIITGVVSENEVGKSRYIKKIENRFDPFSKIEQLLDDNHLIFRYNEKQQPFSSIQADYLLSSPYIGNDIYIFIAEKEQPGLYFCRSFFPKESKDYTVGQPIYTLLYKEKIVLSTGSKTVQYNHLISSSAV